LLFIIVAGLTNNPIVAALPALVTIAVAGLGSINNIPATFRMLQQQLFFTNNSKNTKNTLISF